MLIRYNQSNKLANKLGAEAFWPMSLDKESEKAAAILRTFTRDGFQVKAIDRDGNHTKSLVKIPPNVLQEAKGLAIFTVFRTGLHISGAGGSGILIARQPDGSEYIINNHKRNMIIIELQPSVHLPAFSCTQSA
jgi:lipid-binding SYLF domain-containing protein